MKLYHHPLPYFGRLLQRSSLQKVLNDAAPHLEALASLSK